MVIGEIGSIGIPSGYIHGGHCHYWPIQSPSYYIWVHYY
jgi:hypothetical protein